MKKLIGVCVMCILLLVGCNNNDASKVNLEKAEEVFTQYIEANLKHDYATVYNLYEGSAEDWAWLAAYAQMEDGSATKEQILENYVKVQVAQQNYSLNEIVEKKAVSEDEFAFTFNLKNEDGSKVNLMSDLNEPYTDIIFTVRNVDGKFKVVDLFPYQE